MMASSVSRTVQINVIGDTTRAQTALSQVATHAETTGNRMGKALSNALGTLTSTGLLGPFGESLTLLQDKLDQVGEHAKTAAAKIGLIGAGLAAGGGLLTAIGAPDVQAHAQLDAALSANGDSIGQYKDQIEKANAQQANWGHTTAQSEAALTKLYQSSGDMTKALQDEQLAANLAASRHMDLSAAADLVSRIDMGKAGKSLAFYGIDAKKAGEEALKASGFTGKLTQAQKDQVAALTIQAEKQQIANKTQGQAQAAVAGFSGQLDVMKTKIENAAASFGAKYGPTIMIAGTAMMGLSAAIEVSQAAMAAFDAEMIISYTIAFAPFILAIAAVGAAVYLLWKNWDTIWGAIRKTVTVAFDAIKSVIGAAIDWIKQHWGLILSVFIGPVGLAIQWIVDHWNGIEKFIGAAPGRIANLARGMFDGIKNAFKAAINWIISGWDSLRFGVPSIHIPIPGVPDIPGFSFGVPQIPLLAAGGIITKPTLAMVGEAGPEAVIPLNKGLVGGNITISVPVQLDGRTIASATARYTRDELLRLSRNLPNVGLA